MTHVAEEHLRSWESTEIHTIADEFLEQLTEGKDTIKGCPYQTTHYSTPSNGATSVSSVLTAILWRGYQVQPCKSTAYRYSVRLRVTATQHHP